MREGIEPVHVHSPRSLREVFALFRENPGIGLIAGGTDCLRRLGRGESVRLPGSLLSLAEVDELSRIRRRENSVEIGAAVSLERIISLGGNLVPTLLIRVLERIASPPVRNLATLGGNIALASADSDALLPLLLLDARCELRRPTAHGWLPLARFIKGPGRIALEPLEIITAVSLPLPHWNVRMYVKLDPAGPDAGAGTVRRASYGNPNEAQSEADSARGGETGGRSADGRAPRSSPSPGKSSAGEGSDKTRPRSESTPNAGPLPASPGMSSAAAGTDKTRPQPEATPETGPLPSPASGSAPSASRAELQDVSSTAPSQMSLLKFAALANVSKGTVTDFRFIWGGVDPLFLRSREIEAVIIGSKTPFTPKQTALFTERVAAFIDGAPPSFLPEPYHRRSAVRLARAFLEKVGMYRETWLPKRDS